MNPAIRKEAKVLLPAFVVTLAAVILPQFYLAARDYQVAYEISGITVVACAALMSATSFGYEFVSRTMPLLLVQPASRRRIWGTKMAVLGVFLAAAYVYILGVALISSGINGYIALVVYLCLLGAFCSVPLYTLKFRNAIVGAAMSICVPAGIGLLLFAAVALIWRILHESEGFVSGLRNFSKLHPQLMQDLSSPDSWIGFSVIVLLVLIYCAVCYRWGRASFMRFEEIDAQPKDISLPRGLESAVSAMAQRFTPGYSGPWSSLIRKELHLQRVCICVSAAGVAAFFAALGAVHVSHSELAFAFISSVASLGVFLPAILIPLLASAMSVSEERNWGSLGWQLILPPRARSQWMVKVSVVVAVCAIFAVVVPSALFGMGGQFFNTRAFPSPAYLISGISVEQLYRTGGGLMMYLIALHAGLFASTICANTLRAIITTVGFLVVGGLAGVSAASLISQPVAMLQIADVAQQSRPMGLTIDAVALAIGCALLVLMHRLAYLNFRGETTARERMTRSGIVLVAGAAAIAIASDRLSILSRFWFWL